MTLCSGARRTGEWVDGKRIRWISEGAGASAESTGIYE
jgi:hypothetical protein